MNTPYVYATFLVLVVFVVFVFISFLQESKLETIPNYTIENLEDNSYTNWPPEIPCEIPLEKGGCKG